MPAHHTAALGTASMPKALCILGMAVSVLLLVVFGLDLVTSWPLHGESKAMDIGFLIAAVVLGYVSWTTHREQV